MTQAATAATAGVVQLERTLRHPPEKVWKALTDASLIGQWLMSTDFQPVVGHRFTFRSPTSGPGWNGVIDGEVLEVRENQRLAYRWDSSGEEKANGLATVVTWTLEPMGGGTRLRLEQSGFQPKDRYAEQGAAQGWPRMIDTL
ncbi:MAG TPA: SRPBCC domain-containing protein, partial [Deinococcales bacterium]|nr:SRPBCC domain-containing protein [Deinococcales bacterium]